MSQYNPSEIEAKWAKKWQEDGTYTAKDPHGKNKDKYYALDMFPYPSGDLHIGHWYAFTPPDIHARFQRMKGRNVMHPIGFDAFGLPAENAAIKRGLDPDHWTQQNISSMLKQFTLTGIGFDMSRPVDTSRPEYYKWTQWIFLKLYEKGLAYRKKARVNWCEHDQTVLANEQVIDGLCWRCDNPVIQKDLEQWFFKITAYAESLLDDLKDLDWPQNTKQAQKNWIGKSEGALIEFEVLLAEREGEKQKISIPVFTTRPDTIYGVSYLVLAPEHESLLGIVTPDMHHEVEEYIEQVQRMSERQRLANSDQKSGVFTGAYAVHPLTGKQVPIWTADYVLSTYGTGAVMGVPAHDKRDFDFASKYALPILSVLEETEDGSGVNKLINSAEFTGQSSQQATQAIISLLEKQGKGKTQVTYRLRDWLVSRQRFWGPPIPMIECPSCGLVPVPEDELPVLLPPASQVDFLPKGKPPLATSEEFMSVACYKCGGEAQRVPETLDTFVDSSWYFLRFADPHNQEAAFDPVVANQWMPVDIYVGGAEHTVLHLMYSRFITKVLRDLGYITADEPFQKLRHQGMILGPDHQKMSKSKGNVVNPDELVAQFGADSVRMQLAFLGPYDQGGPWQLTGIHGVSRFLNRAWQEQYRRNKAGWAKSTDDDVARALAQAAIKIGNDISEFKFNTAIAELMKVLNTVTKAENVSESSWKSFIIILAPFAPFISEELWHLIGNNDSIHNQTWPDLAISRKQSSEKSDISVQVNGKFRAIVQVSADQSVDTIIAKAQQDERISRHTEGKRVIRHIYIPGKVLNLVVQ